MQRLERIGCLSSDILESRLLQDGNWAEPIAAIQKSVIVISWSLAHVLVRAGHNDNTEGIVRILWIACLVAVAVVVPAQRAAWGQEIRISHQWTEGTDGRDRALRVFVQEAEARVKGLKFRIYPNSSLNIKPTELLLALQKKHARHGGLSADLCYRKRT